MPNIKSAKKRVKVSAKRELNNIVKVSSTKNAVKKVVKEAKNGNKDIVNNQLEVALKNIDKSVAKGLMHKNTAARQKSRLTKLKNNME